MADLLLSTKEEISERFRQCLKEVDAFIKSSRLDEATTKLAEARELDPANPYLSAFQARLDSLARSPQSAAFSPLQGNTGLSEQYFSQQKTSVNSNRFAETRTFSPSPVPTESRSAFQAASEWHRTEPSGLPPAEELNLRGTKSTKDLGTELLKKYHRQIAHDRKQLEDEATRLLDVERKRLQDEFERMMKNHSVQLRTIRSEVRQEMEQKFLGVLELISRQYDRKMELLDIHVPSTKADAIQLYRKKMRLYYRTGSPSQENAKKLMELKELLELTFDEHLNIEEEVREELYAFTLRKEVLQGEITLNSYSKIDELRQQFCLMPDQAKRAESLIFSRIRQSEIKGRILLVDADNQHKEILFNGLSERSYQVLTAPNVQDAFEILHHEFIDLILSDVRFPEGELDGFKFFSAVQEQFTLRRIPFVIISAVNDSTMYRCAAQLGVDDILFKPLDIELLHSVIEGKLKRYRELAQV